MASYDTRIYVVTFTKAEYATMWEFPKIMCHYSRP